MPLSFDGAATGNSCRDAAGVSRAIVGKDVTTHGCVVAGNKPGIVTDSREDLPCRRAELEEGDVILNELPMHIEPDRVSAWSAS
jgi:hypothetical protein